VAGNVRELENAIERIHDRGAQPRDPGRRSRALPPRVDGPHQLVAGAGGFARHAAARPALARPLSARLLDEEKREIMAAIERLGGNIAGAARQLGINRSTLYYRLRKHGLEHLLPTKVSGPGEEAGET
jgi:transcriptional regulator of acetoin/glycerol metabolism